MITENKSYDEHYPRVYRSLKHFGLSAFHALNILVNAKRRDKHALFIVKLACGRK